MLMKNIKETNNQHLLIFQHMIFNICDIFLLQWRKHWPSPVDTLVVFRAARILKSLRSRGGGKKRRRTEEELIKEWWVSVPSFSLLFLNACYTRLYISTRLTQDLPDTHHPDEGSLSHKSNPKSSKNWDTLYLI